MARNRNGSTPFTVGCVVALLLGMSLFGCDSPSESPLPGTSSKMVDDSSGEDSHSNSSKNPPMQDEPSEGQPRLPQIVAFGDSLTAGYGVAPDQAYPAILERRLHEAGYNYRVINAGVSGDTTAGGVRRVNWVLKSEPSLVILELGANDGLRGQSLVEMEANLRLILTRLQAAKIPVLLVGMKIPPNYGQEYTTQFEAIYPRLAKEFNLPLMPFFLKDVAVNPALKQGDGVHPNAQGYQVIVDNLFPYVTQLLTCRSPSCP